MWRTRLVNIFTQHAGNIFTVHVATRRRGCLFRASPTCCIKFLVKLFVQHVLQLVHQHVHPTCSTGNALINFVTSDFKQEHAIYERTWSSSALRCMLKKKRPKWKCFEKLSLRSLVNWHKIELNRKLLYLQRIMSQNGFHNSERNILIKPANIIL